MPKSNRDVARRPRLPNPAKARPRRSGRSQGSAPTVDDISLARARHVAEETAEVACAAVKVTRAARAFREAVGEFAERARARQRSTADLGLLETTAIDAEVHARIAASEVWNEVGHRVGDRVDPAVVFAKAFEAALINALASFGLEDRGIADAVARHSKDASGCARPGRRVADDRARLAVAQDRRARYLDDVLAAYDKHDRELRLRYPALPFDELREAFGAMWRDFLGLPKTGG